MSVANAARRLIYLLVVTSLLGCATGSAWFKPVMPLLPVADLDGNWQVTESLSFQQLSDRKSNRKLMAVWSKLNDRFQLVVLSSSGQILTSLSYDGQYFKQENSPLIDKSISLPGRDIVSQLQLYHWPLQKVQAYLASTPWQLMMSGKNKKILFYKNKPFMHFINHGQSVVVQYLFVDQQLTVTTLEKEKI